MTAGAAAPDARPDPPPDVTPAPLARTPQTRRQPSWALVVVALALAGASLAGALATLLLSSDEPNPLEAIRTSALDAARARTVALTTYDHRSLDEDFAGVLETATGEFEADYRRTTEQLRGTFEQTKAVATAKVVAVGLESVDATGDGPERAVAVVAVDQVITAVGAPVRSEHNRLRMELVRPDDTWLVARVERL